MIGPYQSGAPITNRSARHFQNRSILSLLPYLFKADPDKQQEFLEAYEHDKQQAPTEGTRRYFLDGVHPLYGLEVLFCCWLLVGQRLEVGVGGGRKRLNILGAFCPDDHEYVDRRYTDRNLNAQSLMELFSGIMARHPETKRFLI